MLPSARSLCLLHSSRRQIRRCCSSHLSHQRGFSSDASSSPTSPSPFFAPESDSNADDDGDGQQPHANVDLRRRLVLGLCVSRHCAGYALMTYDTKPLKVGLIDLSSLPNVNEKAVEVMGVLNVLKTGQLQVLTKELSQQHPQHAQQPQAADPQRLLEWTVGMQEYSRVPNPGKDLQKVTEIQKLVGILSHDIPRLLGVSPRPVYLRTAREFLATRAGRLLESRSEVLEYVKEKIPNFPTIARKDGGVNDTSYFMSDAWMVATYVQRLAKREERGKNPRLLESLRKRAMKSKTVRAIQQTLDGLSATSRPADRRVSDGLQSALESRVERKVTEQLEKLLDEEEGIKVMDRAELRRQRARQQQRKQVYESLRQEEGSTGEGGQTGSTREGEGEERPVPERRRKNEESPEYPVPPGFR
ncbi:unnamed protein product [Vitrella brassicaformis CCMP3155]|uniref:Uncharacterized protein n=1 Tax=Vitrella brassicaformis (strain CCMP3155) TaxID=1169540 RepID=A0A0G4H6J0_VITBC|nr:unnamed protein product [Vitrella brassicaformis CCMP3155]|eukprot:CEM39462.1 unnamed protein product [Vitrella brassicaformis CCMP3155]